MNINNIPKRFWKMSNPECWLLYLVIVAVMSRFILLFLSVRLSDTTIHSVYLVNQLIYLGLPIRLILYLYLVMRGEERGKGFVLPNIALVGKIAERKKMSEVLVEEKKFVA